MDHNEDFDVIQNSSGDDQISDDGKSKKSEKFSMVKDLSNRDPNSMAQNYVQTSKVVDKLKEDMKLSKKSSITLTPNRDCRSRVKIGDIMNIGDLSQNIDDISQNNDNMLPVAKNKTSLQNTMMTIALYRYLAIFFVSKEHKFPKINKGL